VRISEISVPPTCRRDCLENRAWLMPENFRQCQRQNRENAHAGSIKGHPLTQEKTGHNRQGNKKNHIDFIQSSSHEERRTKAKMSHSPNTAKMEAFQFKLMSYEKHC
jgi:hypothetical protein